MFTTYSASAGSGKTTNLVAEYCALCFKSDFAYRNHPNPKAHFLNRYQNILAITFTNNAAAEMKDRIVNTLTTFAFTDYNDYNTREKAIFKKVVEKLFHDGQEHHNDVDIQTFIQLESKELLRNIIYDYARFSVSTIDTFFQRIIRSSAIHFNLNTNYAIQVNLNEFYLQVIDNIIHDLKKDSDISERLIFMLQNQLENKGKMNIDHLLLDTLKILYTNVEKNHDFLKKLKEIPPKDLKNEVKNWRNNLKNIPTNFQTTIQTAAEQGDNAIKNLSEYTSSGSSKIKVHDWFQHIKENPKEWIEKGEIPKTYLKLGTDECFLKDYRECPEVVAALPDIQQAFREIKKQYDQCVKRYRDLHLLCKHADKLLVLFDLQQTMEKIKELNNIFLLAESNPFIFEEIKDDPTPMIFEKIKYKDFFIDEFQDTSNMQWQDIKPLLQNQAIDTNNGNVILFGDVKQAIYRFRNGDVNLFKKLGQYDTFHSDPCGFSNVDEEFYSIESLQDNWRSMRSIVKFNNCVFDHLSKKLGINDLYKDVEQNVQLKDLGLVQAFISIDNKNAPKVPDIINDFLSNYENAGAADYTTFFNYLKDNKEKLKLRNLEILMDVKDALDRGYRFGDIAILVSGNDSCTDIADMLLKCGFPVITDNSLSLNSAPEINLIIHTLRYLINPFDVLTQATIIYLLSKVKKQPEPFKEIFSKFNPKTSSQENAKTDNLFQEFIEKNCNKKIPTQQWLSEPLFLLVKDIIRFFELEESSSPFIVDFINLVHNYLQNRNGELSNFLTWWEQSVDIDTVPSITMPSHTNAILVSTIHKSKGLEYPVVIIPYTSRGNSNQTTWIDVRDTTTKQSNNMVAYIELTKKHCIGTSYEDIFTQNERDMNIDELNKYYVANTRAKEMLYIVITTSFNISKGISDFVTKHTDQQNDGISFQKNGENQYYFGDFNWKNPKKDIETSSTAIHPKIRTSDFSLHSQKSNKSNSNNTMLDKQVFGTQIHDYLANLKQFPQNEAEVETWVSQVPKEQQEILRNTFRQILQDEELRRCFAPDVKVLNETGILSPDGNLWRPDRIVFLTDKVVVIDYKTGKPDTKYQNQIDNYANLLQQMGYERVEGRILYLNQS